MWLFKEASLMKFHLSRNMKEKGEKWLNFGCFFIKHIKPYPFARMIWTITRTIQANKYINKKEKKERHTFTRINQAIKS